MTISAHKTLSVQRHVSMTYFDSRDLLPRRWLLHFHYYLCNSHSNISGSLEDVLIWKVAKWITSTHQLWDLGLEVLMVSAKDVQSALTNKDNIVLAANDILHVWVSGQGARQEAYTNLLSRLRKHRNFTDLATDLTKWVEDSQ